MIIHNQMEDLVMSIVDDVFNEPQEIENQDFCGCAQCRLDVSCYVLNRVLPQYIVSGRGLAHREANYQERLQERVDLVRLVNEGIGRIAKTKRPHNKTSTKKPLSDSDGPFYIFPVIKGRILNGKNFEPVAGISVLLKQQGKLVEMVDQNWQNPCATVLATGGTFFFRPKPDTAETTADTSEFSFELEIENECFESLHHFFSMEIKPELEIDSSVSKQKTFYLDDLYLFPH